MAVVTVLCTNTRCARDVSVVSARVSLPGCCCSTPSLCVFFSFPLSPSPSLYTLFIVFCKTSNSFSSYQLRCFINSLLIALDISVSLDPLSVSCPLLVFFLPSFLTVLLRTPSLPVNLIYPSLPFWSFWVL